jgi:hypothetical protein
MSQDLNLHMQNKYKLNSYNYIMKPNKSKTDRICQNILHNSQILTHETESSSKRHDLSKGM